MKKQLFSLVFVCILLFIALPVGATDIAPSVTLSAAKNTYGNDVQRVIMTLDNNTSHIITMDPNFQLQTLSDGRWNSMKNDKGKLSSPLNAAGVQFPIKPGQSTAIGAYIGDFCLIDGKKADIFTPGSYRIVLQDSQKKNYYAPFQIVRGRIFSDPARYSMVTERSVYDANIDVINLQITNGTNQESGYGAGAVLERKNGESWEVVPYRKGLAVAVEDSFALLPAKSTCREIFSTSPYPLPFQAGEYRIVKDIGTDDTICAEFSILPPDACLKLAEPSSASVTLSASGNVVFTVGPSESSGYVKELWHELLAFQKGTKPVSPSLHAKIDFTGKRTLLGTSRQSVSLYASEGQTWAKLQNKWYYTPDSGLITRLENKGRELGAFLPSTGDALIQSLNALPPLKNVRFTAHKFSSPFPLSGWQSDRAVSGVTLSVFQFPSAADVNKQMSYLYEDGYMLGIESLSGSGSSQAVSFEKKRFDWSLPPHYFKAGSRLVLYNGSDKAILAALTGLLGPQAEPVS